MFFVVVAVYAWHGLMTVELILLCVVLAPFNVAATWTGSRLFGRSTEAVFVVHHSGGISRVQVDQSEVGNSWVFLGEFHFEAGTAGAVVLSNQGSAASKVVVADAVRFGGGIGDSGLPRWREAAKAFLPMTNISSMVALRSSVKLRTTFRNFAKTR